MTSEQLFRLCADTQLLLCGIIAGAALLLQLFGRPDRFRFGPVVFAGLILLLVSVMYIFAPPGGTAPTDSLLRLGPLPVQTAATWMLLSDVVVVALLVGMTGGSDRSAFSPLLFMLPTFAWLLFEGRWQVNAIFAAAAVAFTATLFWYSKEYLSSVHTESERHPIDVFDPRKGETMKHVVYSTEKKRIAFWNRLSYWGVSVGCLFLAFFIDLRTREKNLQSIQALVSRIDACEVGKGYEAFVAAFYEAKTSQREVQFVSAAIGKLVDWDVRFESSSDAQTSSDAKTEIQSFFILQADQYRNTYLSRPVVMVRLPPGASLKNVERGDTLHVVGNLAPLTQDSLYIIARSVARR
ncbi:MAG: hypothetical protein M3Z32_12500 [Acidobacteriota bacterium]|nr:hypothetical protein [Acidobacteriota bacterium]